jgi:hypothetical protein
MRAERAPHAGIHRGCTPYDTNGERARCLKKHSTGLGDPEPMVATEEEGHRRFMVVQPFPVVEVSDSRELVVPPREYGTRVERPAVRAL